MGFLNVSIQFVFSWIVAITGGTLKPFSIFFDLTAGCIWIRFIIMGFLKVNFQVVFSWIVAITWGTLKSISRVMRVFMVNFEFFNRYSRISFCHFCQLVNGNFFIQSTTGVTKRKIYKLRKMSHLKKS